VTTFVLLFLAGLSFSGHCLAMCGPFPAALSAASRTPRRALALQLLYHLGKTTTYVFLGVLVASAGIRLERFQRSIGIVAGLLLILVGLAGLLPAGNFPRAARWLRGAPFCAALASLLGDGKPASALTVGLFNGFLPCALVYGMLAYAATLASTGAAALSMIAFSLGTVPALALVGLSSRLLKCTAVRRLVPARLARVSGVATLFLGGLALWRALEVGDCTHIHHLLPPSVVR